MTHPSHPRHWQRPAPITALTIALAFLSSCAMPPHQVDVGVSDTAQAQGDVTGEALAAPLDERYAVAPGTRFEQPTAYPENPMPIYPEALLAARLPPVQITVRVIVDEQGKVTRVTPLQTVPAEHDAFIASVRNAVAGWKFLPLVRVTEAPGTTDIRIGDVTARYDGQALALPFHQVYSFTFRQLHGRPSVSRE